MTKNKHKATYRAVVHKERYNCPGNTFDNEWVPQQYSSGILVRVKEQRTEDIRDLTKGG